MATAHSILSDEQVIGMLKPEHQPAKPPSPQALAVEYLNDFAGCYAISPAARKTLQHAINAAAPSNNAVAPSERAPYIASALAYFRPLLERDAGLTSVDVDHRIDQLQRSLAGLEESFELPLVSMASHVEAQRPRHAKHANNNAPLTSYREAKAFLQEFSDTYAQEPRAQELLQGAISLAARGRSPIGKADRDVARNEILRYFENNVRRMLLKEAAIAGQGLEDPQARAQLMSDAADKAEAVNLQLGSSLRTLQYGFSLETAAAPSR